MHLEEIPTVELFPWLHRPRVTPVAGSGTMAIVCGDRDLEWEGAYNLRDLGGLPRKDGGWTRRGEVVRGDAVQQLSATGWIRAHDFGVRAVVDLQQRDEAGSDRVPPPESLTTYRVPLDDPSDVEFWQRWSGGLDCTPLYYPAFLDRFPRRVAEVLAVVADAPPGAVLVHCGSGRDRTGLLALVLLSLVGVTPEAIAADYLASTARLEPAWEDAGAGDQTAKIAALIAEQGTTARDAVVATAEGFDAEAYLRRAGLRDGQLTALRERLVA